MKNKYWFVNSNTKKNQYWIESIMLDSDTDYFKEFKDAYSETIIEAKKKLRKKIMHEIDVIDSKISSLEYKKAKLNNQMLNPEIRDDE
jgi:hypothetical protein